MHYSRFVITTNFFTLKDRINYYNFMVNKNSSGFAIWLYLSVLYFFANSYLFYLFLLFLREHSSTKNFKWCHLHCTYFVRRRLSVVSFTLHLQEHNVEQELARQKTSGLFVRT